MSGQEEDLALASLFPEANREQWRRLVAGVLAKEGVEGAEGGQAEKAYGTSLEDYVFTQPLYTAEDQAPDAGLPGSAPYVRGDRPQGAVLDGWDVRQYHADPDPTADQRGRARRSGERRHLAVARSRRPGASH